MLDFVISQNRPPASVGKQCNSDPNKSGGAFSESGSLLTKASAFPQGQGIGRLQFTATTAQTAPDWLPYI